MLSGQGGDRISPSTGLDNFPLGNKEIPPSTGLGAIYYEVLIVMVFYSHYKTVNAAFIPEAAMSIVKERAGT